MIAASELWLPDSLGLDELEPYEIDAFLARYTDLPWFAEHAPLKVKDKQTTKLVPFRFNYAQRYVWARMWQMANAGMPVRVLVVKARQLGMTTQALAHLVHIALTRRDREMYALLHDLRIAEKAWNRMETMAKHVEAFPQVKITGTGVGRKLIFENGSSILVESVGKRGVGRGDTLHHVKATELPSWDDPEATMDGIEETVPELLNFESSIELESTSEGMGDWWYWKVKAASEGRGVYQMIFLPWWIEPAYGAQDPMQWDLLPRHAWEPGGGRRLADCLREPLTESEEDLGKQILAQAPEYGLRNLTPDEVVQKLLWRRRKREQRGAEKFCQEYPATWQESFLGSGRPVFVSRSIAFHKGRKHDDGKPVVCKAPQRLELFNKGSIIDGTRERQQWDARPNPDGQLHVWKGFERGNRYVIGGDPSSGEAVDPSAVQINKVTPTTFEQVAVWHGHVGQIELAYITTWLSILYGKALIVPESTGEGAAYLNKLVELRYPGWRCYQREVIDATGKKLVAKYGFDMNAATRPAVIETVYDILLTPEPIIRHEQTLFEMEQFRRDKKGRPDHPDGGHSDLLMAWGISAHARHRHAPLKHKPVIRQGMRYEASNSERVRGPHHHLM